MITGLVIFEDSHWRKLRPLTDTLPVPALAFGASTLNRRQLLAAGLPLIAIEARAEVMAAWHARPATAAADATAATAAGPESEALVLNAAVLPAAWLDEIRANAGTGTWYVGERLAAARLPYSQLAPLFGTGADFAARLAALELPRRAIEARVIEYPWHLIEWNLEALVLDLGKTGGNSGDVHPSAILLAPGRIQIAAGARIDPLAVLDARGGSISIGARAVIQSHTLVVGPCAVGEGTQLLGGVIGGSTIGPECRLAGEIEASIWQGYANKRHHGFVGHSVIGEWVNMGALTTTSDLKNNYGPVRMWVDGEERDSGNPKVGSMIGAHVKTGIGTLLPTGASIGVGANLFGGGRFAPKRVESFAWWDGEDTMVHDLDRFLATARVALSRRGRAMNAAAERLLRALFASTEAERHAAVRGVRAQG
ncbi:MAG: putative sugar nucleotidyl transferase [Candidatus Eisenbacteria bacterium]